VNSKQRKTLKAIFAEPAAGNIEWTAIESLLKSVDCKVVEGSGAAVKFRYGMLIAAFHRPHPEKEAKRYQVRDAREFLMKIGVTP
jgi:hypothetical protein